MKETDDNTFSKFVRNELPTAKMKLVEKELMATGTVNAVFPALLSGYMEEESVDELIGEDTEVKHYLEAQKKIFADFCKNLENRYSIMSNNLKFNTMENINLTKEELQKVTERYNNLKNAFDTNAALKDNMLNAYMATRLEADKEEASALIDKLLDGCNKLTNMYNEALAKGDFDVRKEIDTLGKDLSVEERFRFIVNTLAVVEKMNLSTYASLTDVKADIEKAIEEYLAATPNPTQSDCDAMLDALADAINNNTIVLSSAEKARELLGGAFKGKTAAIDFASEQYDDASVKAGMALALWLEYEDGNIPSMPENTTPELVGVGAATAVEQAKVASDVASGRKTVDVAVKCIKILGGVALACLLFYLSLNVTVFVGSMVMLGLMSLFGTSVLAILVAMIAAVAAMWKITEAETDAGIYIMEKSGEAYDKVVAALRETILPAIRKGIENIINWIRTKFSGQQVNIAAY